MSTKALIIGGGVAGPVTAMALERVGIEPIIFEAYPPRPDEVGSYFTVATNGLSALRAIDALQVVAGIGFPTHRHRLWNDNHALLGTIPLTGTLPDGTPSLTVKRARLSRALREEALRRGVTIEFGKRLKEAAPSTGGGVVAQFEDGSEVAGGLLIGADGVHSTTRTLIDSSAPKPRYLGLVNFGGYTRAARLPDEPAAWHLIFGRRAFFGYNADPSGGVVWFANVPREEVSTEERASTTPEMWKAQLLDLFADDRAPATQLIRTGVLELAGDNTYDLDHVPVWHRASMIVIGDAAHAPAPASGQGASMAMEDGVQLAMALRDLPDVASAFEAFEARRRQRVEKIVAHGARASSNKTPGAAGRVIRDIILRVVFRFVVTEKSEAWMHNYRIDWNDRLGPSARTA
jgi:2-polyprenyl-6-methoxyphenol hydroxylase-like FAD-dependent oxidoreductase